MAVTLNARAGSTFRAHFKYWQPDKSALIDTTGYTARFQLKGTQRPGRVLLNTKQYTGALPVPPSTPLQLVEPGHWLLTLDRTITRSLPATASFELELVSDTDPEDVTSLASGVITTNPEVVVNV